MQRFRQSLTPIPRRALHLASDACDDAVISDRCWLTSLRFHAMACAFLVMLRVDMACASSCVVAPAAELLLRRSRLVCMFVLRLPSCRVGEGAKCWNAGA